MCRRRFKTLNPLKGMWIFIVPLFVTLVFVTTVIQKNVETIVVSETEAAKFNSIKQRADKGDANAEWQLGVAYQEGDGVKKDLAQAVKLFKSSAEKNNNEGAYRYGLALLKGLGVLQSYKEAIYWLEKSANAGNKDAQYDLGNIYRYQNGVKVDMKRAYMWFSLAAAQGLIKAEASRNAVEQYLQPDDIAVIQEQTAAIIYPK